MRNNQRKSYSDIITDDYNLPLAIVDGIPVVTFGISGILISRSLDSIVFLVGIVICLLAGLAKVLWKITIALWNKNYLWLTRQFRFLMPTGFITMLVALILELDKLNWSVILYQVTEFPQAICFGLGIAGMVCMIVFSKKLDYSVKSNWIEEITNTIAQLLFLTGILLST